MDGGALIAEGGFGCVHYPALDCDGNEINDKKSSLNYKFTIKMLEMK